MGQRAQKRNRICSLGLSCADTVPSASQDLQSLFKYAHKSMLICLCFLLRPAGWPAGSGPELVGSPHSKIATKRQSKMSEFWSHVNCECGSSSLQIFCDLQCLPVVHSRLPQPEILTAFFLKLWDYLCLFLGLPFPPPPNNSWIHLSFSTTFKAEGEFSELTKSLWKAASLGRETHKLRRDGQNTGSCIRHQRIHSRQETLNIFQR